MAKSNKDERVERLKPYRWKPGQSGNAKGRPKKEHELRWYIEGAMLTLPIPPEFWRNAMLILGMQKELKAFDDAIAKQPKDAAKREKIVPIVVRKLTYGQFAALRACYESGKDPELFVKLIEQIEGKPVQPTTIANPDGSPIKPPPSTNVLIVPVPAEEEV